MVIKYFFVMQYSKNLLLSIIKLKKQKMIPFEEKKWIKSKGCNSNGLVRDFGQPKPGFGPRLACIYQAQFQHSLALIGSKAQIKYLGSASTPNFDSLKAQLVYIKTCIVFCTHVRFHVLKSG